MPEEFSNMTHVSIFLTPWRFMSSSLEEYVALAGKLLRRGDVVVTITYFFGPCTEVDRQYKTHQLEEEIFDSLPCSELKNAASLLFFRVTEAFLDERYQHLPWCGVSEHKLPHQERHPFHDMDIILPEMKATQHLLQVQKPTPHVVIFDANCVGCLIAQAYKIPTITLASPAHMELWTQPRTYFGAWQWLKDRWNQFWMASSFQHINRQRRQLHLKLMRTPSEVITKAHLVLVNAFPELYVNSSHSEYSSGRFLKQPKLPDNAIWMGPMMKECARCDKDLDDPHDGTCKLDRDTKGEEVQSSMHHSTCEEQEDPEEASADDEDLPSIVILPMALAPIKTRTLMRAFQMVKHATSENLRQCQKDENNNLALTDYCEHPEYLDEWDIVMLREEGEEDVPFDVAPCIFEFNAHTSLWKQVTNWDPIMLVSYCGPEVHALLSTGVPILCLPRERDVFITSRAKKEFEAAQRRVAYLSNGEVLYRYNAKEIAETVIKVLQKTAPPQSYDRLRGIDWWRSDRVAGYIQQVAHFAKLSRDNEHKEVSQAEVLRFFKHHNESSRDPYDYLTGDYANDRDRLFGMVARSVAVTILTLFALSLCMLPEVAWSSTLRRAFRRSYNGSEGILGSLDIAHGQVLLWMEDQESSHANVLQKLHEVAGVERQQLASSDQQEQAVKKGTSHAKRRRHSHFKRR
jgi:hypothetical protein